MNNQLSVQGYGEAVEDMVTIMKEIIDTKALPQTHYVLAGFSEEVRQEMAKKYRKKAKGVKE